MRRRRLLKNIFTNPLTLLFSIVLGGLISWILPDFTQYFTFIGDLYIRMIILVATPFIFISILSGTTILKHHKNMKMISMSLLKWFLLLFFIYWLLGVGLALILKPGVGITLPVLSEFVKEVTTLSLVKHFFNNMIPKNITHILSDGKSLMVYALIIGISINLLKREDVTPCITVLDILYQIFYKLTKGVFFLLPIGLLSLAVSMYPSLDINLLMDYLILVIPTGVVTLVIIIVISLYFWKRSSQVYIAVLKEYLRVLLFSLFTPNTLLITPLYSHFIIHKLKFERDASDFSIPVTLMFYRFGTVLFTGFMAVLIMQAGSITIGLEVLLLLLLWTLFITLFSAGMSENVVITFFVLVLNRLGIMNRELVQLLLALEFISLPLRVIISSSSAMFVSAALSKPKAFVEDDFVHGVLLQNLPENVNLRRYFCDYEGELPVIGIEVTDFLLSVFPYALIKEYKSWQDIEDSWSSFDINIVVGDREELKDIVDKGIEGKLVALNRRHQ